MNLEIFIKLIMFRNNATLSIAGDIDEDDAKDLIEEYFSGIPRGTKKMNIPTEVEPPQKAEVRDTIYDNIQFPAVIEAYHIPAQGTKDYYAINMLTHFYLKDKVHGFTKILLINNKKRLLKEPFHLHWKIPGCL